MDRIYFLKVSTPTKISLSPDSGDEAPYTTKPRWWIYQTSTAPRTPRATVNDIHIDRMSHFVIACGRAPTPERTCYVYLGDRISEMSVQCTITVQFLRELISDASDAQQNVN